jgi:pilus assembly protein FimV
MVPMAFSRALALLMLAPALAVAADLGRLTVLTGVGQPLRAEIEILSVRPGEGGSLSARIPPPDAFWRANLEPPPMLDALRARVEPRPKGRYVVVLSSSRPIEDPFIQILVELDSSTGRIVREYPFLLDERREQVPRIAVAPPVQVEMVPGVPLRPSPGATSPQREAAANEARETYMVRAGDTLAAIARATKSPDVTLDQAVVALYQANAHVFTRGNMNLLPVGEVLALPREDAARSIEPGEARRIILAHGAAVNEVRRHASGALVPGTAPGGEPAAEKTAGARANQATVTRTPGDQLQLTRAERGKSGGGSGDAAREDDIVALQRALAEAQERIALLQKDLDDVRRLLALKGQQLGGVERRDRSAPESATRISAAVAAQTHADEGAQTRGLERFLRDYSVWLVATFLLGYVFWVVMPLKTALVWRERRRRRENGRTGQAGHNARSPRTRWEARPETAFERVG